MDGFTFCAGRSDPNSGKFRDLPSIIRKISEDPRILNDLKANIQSPPRIEEEAFEYECLYRTVLLPEPAGPPDNQTTDDPKKSGPGFQNNDPASRAGPPSPQQQKNGV
jgi:hypothetical protein